MTCGDCGGVNEAGRKFCADCGARLVTTCAVCGTPNAPTARFCGECGAPLAGAPAAIPGQDGVRVTSVPVPMPTAERRVVSVLFADLVGFTPFAEERDAEDVRETLSRYFEVASEVIARYGGTVEKFIGDAVMAVWGAPVAQEDDAERAVRAGLELVDAVRALGPGIRARAGVLTGEAAVTLGATNQGMVAGDLVNTAARLQSVARPGTVLAGEATVQASAGAIAFEPAGDQILKGKAAPVAAWRALRIVAERGGRNRADGLEAPFVGRDDELRLLKDWFHLTGRDRRLRTVSITGQAGIGKSRLAWEFEKYLDGLVEPVFWHHGRSPSIGGALPFWALGEMMRGRFRLAEADDEATVRARIAEALPAWIPDVEERRWVEGALHALLGTTGSEAGGVRLGHEQLFGAWRTLLERIAAAGTVVLVFEDLHWADDGMLAFVDHLVEWSRSAPILLVTLARPELLERRADWGSGLRHFVNLPLDPLPDAAMRALLAGLVPGLPEAAATAIVGRADGIPLYAVETVRMLVAERRLTAQPDGTFRPSGDLSALAVPTSLQSLIAARLDALDPADRAALQAASVLGQSFAPSALAALLGGPSGLDDRLSSLVRRELLVHDRDPRSPERGQYAFVQALLRDVAYATLARADRRRLHLAAARHYEGMGDDAAPGALATQYLAAWSASAGGPEADALAGQARLALTAAAERAASLGSMEQAVALLQQALDVTSGEAERAAILERAGDQATSAGRMSLALELLSAAESIYRDRGDRGAEARVIARRAWAMSRYDQRDQGAEMVGAAVGRFLDLGDDPGVVDLLAQHSRFHFLAGRYDDAVAVADQTLPMAERLDRRAVIADLLVTRGTSLSVIGRPVEGLAVLEGGLKLAVADRLTAIELRARVNLSGRLSSSDVRAGLAVALAGVELATRLGLAAYVPDLVSNLANCAVETGDWDLAVEQLERALETSTRSEADRVQHEHFLLLIAAARGEESGERLERVTTVLRRWEGEGVRIGGSALRYLQGVILSVQGHFAEACDVVLEAAAMDPFNANADYGWALDLAAAARDGTRIERARQGLIASDDRAAAGRAALLAADAYGHALAGRAREAGAAFQQGLAMLDAIGAGYTRVARVIGMASLVGADDREVRTALEVSREWLVRVRARSWSVQVEALLRAADPATTG